MCMQRIFVFKYWEIQKINLPNKLLNIMNIIHFKYEKSCLKQNEENFLQKIPKPPQDYQMCCCVMKK